MRIIFWGIATFLLMPFLAAQHFQLSIRQANIRESLLSIPDKDVEILKTFFKSLFVHSGFAYTLLEAKPMVWVDYNLDVAIRGLADKKGMNCMAIAYRGGQIWEKYKHLFHMHQFELINYASRDFSTFGFILFNRKSMKAFFEKNKKLFYPILGDVKNLPELFRHFLLPKEHLGLQYHQAFGILLGYGNKNAMAFRKRSEMFDFLKSAPLNLQLLNDVDVHCIQQDRVYSGDENMHETQDFTHNQVCEAIQTLNDLRGSFKFTPTTNRGAELSPIELPGFLAIPEDEETQQIKESFDRVRAQIIEILYSENFLERILMHLTS